MQNWLCTHPCGHSSSKFYGHVTPGLRIHFSYLSQPSVSKTCSFINSCIHPSLFWGLKKTHSIHPSGVHIFSQKSARVLNGKFIFFQKRVGFLFNQIIFLFSHFLNKRVKTACILGTIDIWDYIFEKVMRTRVRKACTHFFFAF